MLPVTLPVPVTASDPPVMMLPPVMLPVTVARPPMAILPPVTLPVTVAVPPVVMFPPVMLPLALTIPVTPTPSADSTATFDVPPALAVMLPRLIKLPEKLPPIAMLAVIPGYILGNQVLIGDCGVNTES